MNIKILNKNRISASGTYGLSNIKSFSIDEGSTIIENYNETLDSATIRISNLTSKIEIDVLDKAILYDDVANRLDARYFVVDSFNETMISLNPVIYSYEIQLVSETKLLEGVILPNLAITPLKSDKRSIYDYLVQYLNLYSPKVRVFDLENATYNFENEFVLDETIEDKFDDIDCPEMQWNTPTLREVLTDLMMVADCIPVVRHNTIYYINLTEKKTDITSIMASKVNYISQSKSSSDYCSEIQMTMQNVTQTEIPNVNNIVSRVEYQPFTSDASIITSGNCFLKTQYPIYKIKHLWMVVYRRNTTTFPELESCLKDLCALNDDDSGYNGSDRSTTRYSLVKEYDEYKTLNKDYKIFDLSLFGVAKPMKYYSNKRNYCIYYKRGSNIINGFETTSKIFLNGYQSIMYILQSISGGLTISTAYDKSEINAYFNGFFKIEYETTAEQVFKASKDVFDNNELNNKIIVDNQTNSFVDAYNQGFLEYQKANRLGNVNKMINARFTSDWSSLIKIGDYFDNDIIYQCQYQIYNNHIEVNATSCPNYILRDYYTGVKSKLRTWVNATNEALKRHDIEKQYLQFDFTQHTEIENKFIFDNSYFLSPFVSGTSVPVKYALVRTTKGTTYFPANDSDDNYQYYSLELISRVMGNSVVLTCGFNDNYIVCYHPSKADSDGNPVNFVASDFYYDYPSTETFTAQYTPVIKDSVTDTFFEVIETEVGSGGDVKGEKIGGIPLEMYTYADENSNFEFDTIDIVLVENINNENLNAITTSWNSVEVDVVAPYVAPAQIIDICRLPLILNSETKDSGGNSLAKISLTNKAIYKDNKEIPTLSMQFEFSSATRDIYFTKQFIYAQKLIKNYSATFYLFEADLDDYYYNKPTLETTERTLKGEITTLSSISNASITFTGLTANKAYFMLAGDGTSFSNDVIFAFANRSELTSRTIHLNKLSSRDLRKYSRDTYGNLIRVSLI